MRDLLVANSQGHTLAFQQRFVDKLGPNLEQRLLGDSGYVTLDPENVKAVLSKSITGSGELGRKKLFNDGILSVRLIEDRLRLWSAT